MNRDEQAMENAKNLRIYCELTGCLYCCFNGQHSCRVQDVITSGRHRRVFGSRTKWINSEALREKIAQARLIDEADPAAAINAIMDQMEDG